MISPEQYKKEWIEKLVKNRKEQYSFIEFFGYVSYDTIEKMPSLDINNKEKQPTNIIRARKIWVEGTRDNFALYLYDETNDLNYFLNANYYANTKAFVYRILPQEQNSKSFYALQYYKNYPIIVSLDEKMPKKYLIINNGKFTHTDDVNKALKQSLKNFYYFYDDITKKLVKEYLDHKEFMRKLKIGGYIVFFIALIVGGYLLYNKYIKKPNTPTIEEGKYEDYGDYDDEDYDDEDYDE